MLTANSTIRDPFEYEMTQVRKQKIIKDMLIYLWPAFLEKVFHRHFTEQELEHLASTIRAGFEYCRASTPAVTDQDYDALMARLLPILRTHRAFGLFVLGKRGEISPTYIPWALNILDKQRGPFYAKALMMALGEGEDFSGRPCEVTSAEPHYFEHVVTGWGYIEARHRSIVARKCIMDSKCVLVLGAGYLPELSPKFGGQLPEGLRVVACDTDTSIDSAALQAKYPEINLDYRHIDMLSLLRECRAEGRTFDTIIMDGVLSYNLNQIDEILDLAISQLNHGGNLVFDLLLLHPELINLRFVLDWGTESSRPLKLMPTKGAARRLIQKRCRIWAPKLSITSSDSGLYHWTSALTFKITKH